MKFFRRNRRHKIKDLTNSRSVVYIERNRSLNGPSKHLFKGGFKGRRLIRSIRLSKKLILIFLFLLAVFFIVVFLFRFSVENNDLVSPLPVFKMSQNAENEVDRNLQSELIKKNIEFEKIDTSRGSVFYITLRKNQLVIIAGDKDIASQISTLQFINNRLTMEGREFKRLDLRFEKPVITLK